MWPLILTALTQIEIRGVDVGLKVVYGSVYTSGLRMTAQMLASLKRSLCHRCSRPDTFVAPLKVLLSVQGLYWFLIAA